jgi:uncharacterized protein (DUF608 family)
MNRGPKFGCLCVMICFGVSVAFAEVLPVDGTTGAPLGGGGCGGVKFKASDGTFTGTFGSPCALGNFQTLNGTQFQVYTNRASAIVTNQKLSAVITNGRSDDDAAYPVHTANFGTVNNVALSLTAVSPVNFANVGQMVWPYAFYQITVTNTAATPVDVAVALQASTTVQPMLVAGIGFKDASTTIQHAVYAAGDDPAAIVSVGSDNGFLTSGQCNNTITGSTNRVAVKVTMAANQTRKIKFVYSWYNGSVVDRFYYLNTFSNAGAVADSGLAHFDQFITNATTFVSRVRASNIPSWFTDQCLCSYCNFTNNSMYTKDGRYAHTEGEWNTNGTMDQMWHARWIYIQSTPALIWQEMRYWARTQMTNPAGQIHHDLGGYGMSVMCAWDDQQHADYRDITKWVDLNCAFITSVYELFISTDDHAQLDFLWPYVKLAGQRIRDMVTQYGNATYPGTFNGTQNSYDAGGSPDPYNASLSGGAYKMLSYLAEVKGETALKQTYDQAYTTVVNSFKNRYLTNNFPSGRISESIMAGEWLGLFLKMGSFWDSASVAYALKSLDAYYHPLDSGIGFKAGSYNEWAPYLIAHYAGLELETGHFAEWKSMQLDWWERDFNNRNLVYNQRLDIPLKVTTPVYIAASADGYGQYMSVPVSWRNYYAIAGFFRNKHSGELWLEPTLITDLNHQLTNALVISPEGYATITCSESGSNYNTHTIVFKPDNPMLVTGLYVRDKGLPGVYVSVNGVAQTFTRIGSGFAKELKVAFSGTVPPGGITVVVSDQPVGIRNRMQQTAGTEPKFIPTRDMFIIRTGAGMHDITIVSMDGKIVAGFHGIDKKEYRFGSRPNASSTSVTLGFGVYLARIVMNGKAYSRIFVLTR